jgi:2,3-bisphosphoglycerate-independent phosphoglycerate mutase
MQTNKAMLVVLDGWGIGDKSKSDAVFNAYTPFTDSLYNKYPHTQMLTFGKHVGLPDGQMGNSEVGHMNLGAGRIVWQMLAKINNEFSSNLVDSNSSLNTLFNYCILKNKTLHLAGLLSNGGVHASIDHLFALIQLAIKKGVPKIAIHAFMDGRDTDPKSGKGFLTDLLHFLSDKPQVVLASIVGRYYAMDRDKRWERTAIAYHCLVNGKGILSHQPLSDLQAQYDNGVTDEFLMPIVLLNNNNEPAAPLLDDDAFLCFNFRTDRGRQLIEALTQQDFHEYNMHKLALNCYTFTQYDQSFNNVKVVFENENLFNTLGEVLANAHKSQVRAAETEKYPHVTFFFSGGREQEFIGENRILENSPKVATYDLQPEMSAHQLMVRVIDEIKHSNPDFVCLNFANPDMVGHTGVYNAIVKAVETVDYCLQQVVETALKLNYTIVITADHGNADFALNEDGSPNTAHSTNPVPLWLVTPDAQFYHLKQNCIPADIAPTILKIMNVNKPNEMTGNAIF